MNTRTFGINELLTLIDVLEEVRRSMKLEEADEGLYGYEGTPYLYLTPEDLEALDGAIAKLKKP